MGRGRLQVGPGRFCNECSMLVVGLRFGGSLEGRLGWVWEIEG